MIYGQQLFLHDPADVHVGRAVINLSNGLMPPDLQTALTTADVLLKQHPQDATIYAQIFFAEALAFISTKNKANGDAALTAWAKVKQFATPKEMSQYDQDPLIQGNINYIRKQ